MKKKKKKKEKGKRKRKRKIFKKEIKGKFLNNI